VRGTIAGVIIHSYIVCMSQSCMYMLTFYVICIVIVKCFVNLCNAVSACCTVYFVYIGTLMPILWLQIKRHCNRLRTPLLTDIDWQFIHLLIGLNFMF